MLLLQQIVQSSRELREPRCSPVRAPGTSAVVLTNSSHTTQLFIQLGQLQGAEAPSGLAGFSGWSLCRFSEEEWG